MEYYNILEVSREATDDEIKKSYKKLALKYHPDRGSGDEEKFKSISEAYNVLSDPEKKKIYDLYGKEGLQGAENGGSPFHNPFDMMFQKKRKRAKEVQLPVSLEEVFTGKCKVVDIKRRVIDQSRVTQCSDCNGRGVHVKMQNLGGMMFQQAMDECRACHGVGNIVPDDAVTISDEKIGLNIPPGCIEGSKVVVHGMMDQIPGEEPGDLVFIISYKTHSTYTPLENGDLETTVKINLFEALTGFSRILKHPDGTFITFSHKEVTTPNTKWTVLNEGLRRECNLQVKVEIEFPSQVSEDKTTLTSILHQKKVIQRVSHTDVSPREVKLTKYVPPQKSHRRMNQEGPECVQQ